MSLYDALRRILGGGPGAGSPSEAASRRPKSEEELLGDAEAILQAAVAAVDPRKRVARELGGLVPELTRDGNVWVVGFGKAAAAMATGVRDVLGNRPAGGVLVVPVGSEADAPAGFDAFGAGHPVPDPAGVAGSRAIRQLVREAREGDDVIVLLSGGGSAMLTLPPEGVPLEDVQQVTEALLRAGATIGDLNCVRKHLDQLKGGGLAKVAAPARVIALVLSDVVGDALDVVASGPVSPDPTSFADAVGVLERHGVWKDLPLAARGHLDRGLSGEAPENPRANDPCFGQVITRIVGNGATAARAACEKAERLGYRTELLTSTLTGEAREAGRFLAETAVGLAARPGGRPACLMAAGETVVTVRGEGVGGRNQEIALGAAATLAGLESALIASLGTDGIDGPTEAAGAFVTGSTVSRAEARGLDAEGALARNDAYPFFRALDDLIVSGPTGTNVADVQVVLLG